MAYILYIILQTSWLTIQKYDVSPYIDSDGSFVIYKTEWTWHQDATCLVVDVFEIIRYIVLLARETKLIL